MKIPQVTPVVSGQVVADSANPATVLTGEWMLAAGATTLAAILEQRAIQGTGTFTGKARYRTASVKTDQPNDFTDSATGRTTEDVFVDTWDLTTTTDQMWVQVAAAAQTSGGVSECLMAVHGQVDGKAMIVASQTVEVQPTTNSGNSSYVWLGRPFPQLGLTKVMLGYIFTGVSGTITYRPVFREFKGNPQIPDGSTVVNLGGADSTKASDGTVNSGQLTVTVTTGYTLGQVGIKFSGDARGRIEILVAATY